MRLDFIDYQGTHWVRAANGKATKIEKLKGNGFEKLPRTTNEPYRPTVRSRFKTRITRATGWVGKNETTGSLR